jgi:hypothetical protein
MRSFYSRNTINVKERKGRAANSYGTENRRDTKEHFDGKEYVIQKIVQNTAMVESQNGRKQILTEVTDRKGRWP